MNNELTQDEVMWEQELTDEQPARRDSELLPVRVRNAIDREVERQQDRGDIFRDG